METNQISVIWNEWEIEGLLGEGASGKVYKAKRKDIEETYSAIKVIEIPQNESEIREARAEGMEDTEIKEYFKGFVDDLVEEITLLETLKEAKGVVGISDYKVVEKEGKIGWTIYIRMELLTGINDYIKNNKIEENDIINLGIDLCEALEYCERLKIIHRDIKPENIFITKFGEYKLGDFGIARRLENTSSIMSKKGTYLYMPPEVYKGEEYDKTVDIYSLGLVMYKLGNYNRTPFLPPAPNAITYRDKEKALMMRMQGEKIPKPENMTDELYEIIEKMIAYNPKERYKSAKQAKQDLEKLKEKTVRENTGTVNIFTHKSNTNNKPEKKPQVEKQENIFYNVNEVKVENIQEPNEIDEKNIKLVETEKAEDKEKQKQVQETNRTEQQENTTTTKKTRKKVIILIISILLILAITVIAILFSKKQTEKVSSKVVVPNLINLSQEQAEKEIEGKELEIQFKDTYQEGAEKGIIVYQSIAANSEVKKGTTVIVFVNNLEKDQLQKVIMINVVGMNIDDAMTKLLEMGLQVEKIEENSDTVEANIVIEQNIAENQEIDQGTKVTLKISLGSQEENLDSNNNQQIEQGNSSNNKEWSQWLLSLPSGVNSTNYNIEQKTQYSYRTKETTTSTQSNLSGWTQGGVLKTSYSEWGNTQTTTNKPTETDTLKIINQTSKTIYYWYHWHSECRWGEAIGPDEPEIDNVSYLSTEKHTITSTELFPDRGNNSYCTTDKNYYCKGGSPWWWLETKKVETVYTYQTRTLSTTYSYYKWSEWSDYTDYKQTTNANKEEQTRTLYRYKEK